jgi:peptidoglycan/LPS O-acetylase OafA/YrhL
MSTSHAYRPDVDGLRAIAVLGVLAFHAFPHAAPGGFAGVDVFFVISGFLITGIVLDDLGRGRFTFADFYWRRVRRLFPALILVLAAGVGIGWLVLLPDEFSRLGKHVAAGAGFIANLAFWRETGYFDTSSELKPLLHLWSLGVEEQYYLVWPLLLFAFRAWPRAMLGMIAAVAAASFAANLWLVHTSPSAAFYLPVTRFWELLAGSSLAWLAAYRRSETARLANVKAWSGLVLVAAGFALLDRTRAFPGFWALLPVAGTALLVAAGPRAWVNRTVLAHRTLVYAGLVSYPLYLWHWPLLSYARIAEDGEPSVALRLALLAASLVLACATYEFVEKKIRFARPGALVRRVAVPALAVGMSALGALGVAAFYGRVTPESAGVPLISEISRASLDWSYGGDRVIRGDSQRAVLFFGDSHMQHYAPRIEKIVAERAAPVHTVIFRTAGGCAPVPGIERRSTPCARFVENGFALARSPEVATVVIAASWVGFVSRPDYVRVGDEDGPALKLLAPQSDWVWHGFEAALRELVAHGKRVVVMLSSPRGDAFDPKSVIRRHGMTVQVRGGFAPVPLAAVEAVTASIDERLTRIAAAAGAAILAPTDWLCRDGWCPAADERGRPLYKDATHLRASYARERFEAVDCYVYVTPTDFKLRARGALPCERGREQR